MRQLVLVGVLLGAASSPARDARTTFNVGAYVVESCEVSTAMVRGDGRCAGLASRELRAQALPQASVSGEGGLRRDASSATPREANDGMPREASRAPSRDAAAVGQRILLIRF